MWIERSGFVRDSEPCSAGITQLAECQICNLNVVGANPTTGFMSRKNMNKGNGRECRR